MADAAAKKSGWPWWAKLLLVIFGLSALARACDTNSGSQQPSSVRAPDKAAAAAAEAQRAQAEAARMKQECAATIDTKKREYAALMKERKYWDAALAIRNCSDALGTPDLAKLVRESEVASHLADINNPKLPPRSRANAMQLLARDYPDVGAKYSAQADKLIAEADRRDQEEERKRKRSQGVSIGMTKEDVLASSWGRPESINTTTNARGTREQWVYGGRNYLYFENGILVTIQN